MSDLIHIPTRGIFRGGGKGDSPAMDLEKREEERGKREILAKMYFSFHILNILLRLGNHELPPPPFP